MEKTSTEYRNIANIVQSIAVLMQPAANCTILYGPKHTDGLGCEIPLEYPYLVTTDDRIRNNPKCPFLDVDLPASESRIDAYECNVYCIAQFKASCDPIQRCIDSLNWYTSPVASPLVLLRYVYSWLKPLLTSDEYKEFDRLLYLSDYGHNYVSDMSSRCALRDGDDCSMHSLGTLFSALSGTPIDLTLVLNTARPMNFRGMGNYTFDAFAKVYRDQAFYDTDPTFSMYDALIDQFCAKLDLDLSWNKEIANDPFWFDHEDYENKYKHTSIRWWNFMGGYMYPWISEQYSEATRDQLFSKFFMKALKMGFPASLLEPQACMVSNAKVQHTRALITSNA